ncbi:PaaI family thioesterase [Phenylobacterium sp.]|jgi:uncharacterized protein (TIGR00369 family)|uniref:PaaI family thioesterase n=1 Tax=Phenylobacterium sp. TaxID=1871053 RepID=UPI002F959275
MAAPQPKLTADEVNALMRRAFPDAPQDGLPKTVAVAPGRVTVVRAYSPGMLRPGQLISGPNLMGIADNAAYALVLAHVGDQLMAVTSSLLMNFLRGAKPGDIHAEAELLHLGRRNAVCDVRLWTESPDRICAQANVTYALPLS